MFKIKAKFKVLGLLIMVAGLAGGCGFYSFSGVSIGPDVKTISIGYFQNNASLVQPVLSQQFTEALKDIFIRQSRLSLVNNNGDMDVQGQITGYEVSPVAIQGNETAAMNRLTIRVRVTYVNRKEKNKDFESEFSRYTDFEGATDFNAKEEELMKLVYDQLSQDIFDKIMINW
ncbi:MAG: LptE family protein [Flavobacteriales bacterium]|nr:LptE family protein [Flavobacteriales bacterium]